MFAGFYGDPDAAHEKFVEKLFETACRRHRTIHIPPILRLFRQRLFFSHLLLSGPLYKGDELLLAFVRVTVLRWMSFLFLLFFPPSFREGGR